MAKDNIPSKDSEFDEYFKNIMIAVDEKTGSTPPEWTHIPPESRQELYTAFGAWTTAYENLQPQFSAYILVDYQRPGSGIGHCLNGYRADGFEQPRLNLHIVFDICQRNFFHKTTRAASLL
jgi:hypothetical protein